MLVAARELRRGSRAKQSALSRCPAAILKLLMPSRCGWPWGSPEGCKVAAPPCAGTNDSGGFRRKRFL